MEYSIELSKTGKDWTPVRFRLGSFSSPTSSGSEAAGAYSVLVRNPPPSANDALDFRKRRSLAHVRALVVARGYLHNLEVFATDVNNLFVSDSFLGYATAVKARLVLKKPHPVFGFVNGKAAYGIRRVPYR